MGVSQSLGSFLVLLGLIGSKIGLSAPKIGFDGSKLGFSGSKIGFGGSKIGFGRSKFICPGPGYFADPESCTAFYRCINRGTSYRYICPAGTIYDATVSNCNHAFLAPPCAAGKPSQKPTSAPWQTKPPQTGGTVPPQLTSTATSSSMSGYPEVDSPEGSSSVVSSSVGPGSADPSSGGSSTGGSSLEGTSSGGSSTGGSSSAGSSSGGSSSGDSSSGGSNSESSIPGGSGMEGSSLDGSNLGGLTSEELILDGSSSGISGSGGLGSDGSSSSGSAQDPTSSGGSSSGGSEGETSSVGSISEGSSSGDSSFGGSSSVVSEGGSTNTPSSISGDTGSLGSTVQGAEAEVLGSDSGSGVNSGATDSPEKPTPTGDSQFTVSSNSIYPCPSPGYFKEPSNCREFYACKEVLPGVLSAERLYRCPERYLFDPASRLCQRQEKVDCQDLYYSFRSDLSVEVREAELDLFFAQPLTFKEAAITSASRTSPEAPAKVVFYPGISRQISAPGLHRISNLPYWSALPLAPQPSWPLPPQPALPLLPQSVHPFQTRISYNPSLFPGQLYHPYFV